MLASRSAAPAAGEKYGNLLVGFSTGDDAAVWRRPDGGCAVASVDFFPPVVDDPRLWGRIAAANAASDVFAMGGRPVFALNLVVWPSDVLPLEVLSEVLAGGEETASEGGWALVGGHTTTGSEPLYGQAVTGEVAEERLLTNAGARDGQTLVLTKPLGTGVITTALRQLTPAEGAEEPAAGAFRAAAAEMCRLNADAAAAASAAGVTAATDVTGFGLLGHLQKLCEASDAGAALDPGAVPLFEGASELAALGFVPGGTERNLAHFRRFVDGECDSFDLLADPQTSGGLLLTCPASSTDDLLADLASTGHTAAVVGEISSLVGAGRIRLTSAARP